MSEPEDRRPIPRWVAPAYIGFSIVLVPWIVYLGHTLPHRAVSEHYRAAWVGFDVLLLGQLARTGIYALNSRWQHLVRHHAAASSTLLVVDAWFDTMTSSPADRPMSILLAVVVELPLAVLCWWIATGSVLPETT